MATIGNQSQVFIGGSGIPGVQSFTAPAPETQEVDVTHLQSTSMEYIPGLSDSGTSSVELLYDPPTANWLNGMRNQSAMFKYQYPDDSYFECSGYISAIETNVGGSNEAVTQSIQIRNTGEISFSEGA